jgi:hypothetical protein
MFGSKSEEKNVGFLRLVQKEEKEENKAGLVKEEVACQTRTKSGSMCHCFKLLPEILEARQRRAYPKLLVLQF